MSTIRNAWSQLLRLGLKEDTPRHLVDRVIFFNRLLVICCPINCLSAAANVIHGHYFLFTLNVIYQALFFLCFVLNANGRFLFSRVLFLALMIPGFIVTGLVTGARLQNEHYLLIACAISFALFHTTERRIGLPFALVCALSYFALLNLEHPVLRWEPTPFPIEDRLVNQFMYTSLFFLSLSALSKAYDQAAQIVEAQYRLITEQSRLSSVATIANRVAHEINSPLAALELQVHLLEAQIAKNQCEEAMEGAVKIKRLAHRISVLMRGFKYLSRNSQGEPRKHIGVRDLVESSLDVNRDRLHRAKIRLDMDLQNGNEILYCRPVALSQVLLNLVNNSIDAVEELAPTDRWIRIESKTTDSGSEFRVIDGGPLIPREVRKNLFAAFYTTKPSGIGTGLGLNISRQIMREHGGNLQIAEAGPHTTFVATLPKAAEGSQSTDGGHPP